MGGLDALEDHPRSGRPRTFSPEVALHLVRRACDLPEQAGRSLSQWDCAELALQLVIDEIVAVYLAPDRPAYAGSESPEALALARLAASTHAP